MPERLRPALSRRNRLGRQRPRPLQSLSGGAFDGSRLNKLYREDLDHAGIVAALDPLFAAYARERQPGERFSAFAIRAGFVAASGNGRDFHANTGPQRAA